MKCPLCLTAMTNRDERHKLGNGRIRMNLHCHNMDCISRKEISFYPHMGVICNEEIWSGPWECNEYNLSFKIGPWWLVLTGNKTWGSSNLYLHSSTTTNFVMLVRKAGILPVPMNFVSLSTGDDMHEQAWRIVNEHTGKLSRLSNFS